MRQFILLAVLLAACASPPSPLTQQTVVHTYLRETFPDTVFLCDYAVSSAAALGGGTIYVLPQALSFIRCDFRGPVLAGRHERDRLQGGTLNFAESTLAGGLDMHLASLTNDLCLYEAQVRGPLRLDGIRVGAMLDLRRATCSEDTRLSSVSVASFSADRAHFEAGLTLQRALVTETLSMVETEVDGYLDATYLTVYGGAYMEHVKSRDRANFDYAEVRGRWRLAGASFAKASLRYVRAARGLEGAAEGVELGL